MNSECRKYFKEHIQTYLQKYPTSSKKELKTWLRSGEQEDDITMVDRATMDKFITYIMEKFNKDGQCTKHVGGNGRQAGLLPE